MTLAAPTRVDRVWAQRARVCSECAGAWARRSVHAEFGRERADACRCERASNQFSLDLPCRPAVRSALAIHFDVLLFLAVAQADRWKGALRRRFRGSILLSCARTHLDARLTRRKFRHAIVVPSIDECDDDVFEWLCCGGRFYRL
eukprot:3080986-Pleurochrysis_carterae.AAC.5